MFRRGKSKKPAGRWMSPWKEPPGWRSELTDPSDLLAAALLINGDRRLATVASAGQATLQPEILVPEGVEQVAIEADGRVMGSLAGAEPQVLGRLRLVTFAAPELLQPVGGTLLAATARSGLPSPVAIVDGSRRFLVQPRCLELSNVDVELERNNIRVLTEQIDAIEVPTHPLAAGNRDRISNSGDGKRVRQ